MANFTTCFHFLDFDYKIVKGDLGCHLEAVVRSLCNCSSRSLSLEGRKYGQQISTSSYLSI